METKIVAMNPEYLPDVSSRYSHGMVVSGSNIKWILLSGIVAMDEKNKIVSLGDAKGQAEFFFGNIKRLLADSGATMEDIVKINFYITDMTKFKEISEVRDKYFHGLKDKPTSTVMEVSALLMKELMMEIEVTAICSL